MATSAQHHRAITPRAALVLASLGAAAACGRARGQGVAPEASAVVASANTDAGAAAVRPVTPTGPVVVTVVVDQFAAWIAEARLPLLPDDGGFARLRREGTWVRHVRYDYAVTDTAPGHAALYTGRSPRDTGIFANEVPDPRGARVSVLRDAQTHLLRPEGPTESAGSSIARLRVETLADRLRAARPDAAVVSVSIKDRGAIFGGGRTPTATLWFDPGLDTFVTSTAFATAFPAWARAHGDTAAVRALRAEPWVPLDVAWVRAHAATADDQPGEGDLDGFGTTFPHDFARARRPGAALRASPRGDAAIFALALAAVDGARTTPSAPMLLALSLSSNDYVGHLFGPDSWEAWDELRRLDAALGAFLRGLDARLGADGWSMVLSADHGVITMPEATATAAARPWCPDASGDPYARPCGPGGRLDPDAIATELQAAAVTAIGPGAWVLSVADPYVYFTPAADALPPARRARLVAALTTRLRAHPEITSVLDTRVTAERCPDASDESIAALLCRAVPPRVDGALYVLTRPGGFFDPGYVVGYGTSHGSPYLYDRTVPLLVRAPGRTAAGRVVDTPAHFTAFTAAAADLLGLTAPTDAPRFVTPAR